jgi:hypothetical protein
MLVEKLTLERLRAWFQKKGLVNVVLRMQDVAELQPYMRVALKEIAKRVVHEDPAMSGYLVLPVSQVTDGRMNMAELGLLQEIVACYREVRRSNGYPMIEKSCDCGGKIGKCRDCEGTGKTATLVEMSEEEAALAYEREEAAR